MDKPKFETPNITDKNIEKIAALFPNVITEMKDEEKSTPEKTVYKKGVNFEMLKQDLSGSVVEDGEECYDFTWVGKKACIVEGNRPIRETLRPCIEESKNWETTGNLYIEGDNLDVLKLLQESYLNSIKMIYIDPPYNTGNDFIYKDNFAMNTDDYEEQIGLYDEEDNRLFQNNESKGRFHSDWCSMIYPRLKLAQNLLTDDGVIFISIDDNEVHNLRKICDGIFGEANFVAQVCRVAKTTSFRGNYFAPSKDYLLCYCKSIFNLPGFTDEVNSSQFKKIETTGSRKGEYYRDDIAFYLSTLETRPNQRYFIECPDGERVIPPGTTFPPQKPVSGDGVWRWNLDSFNEKKDLIVFKQTNRSPLINENGEQAHWNLYTKSYLTDKMEKGNLPRDLFDSFLNRNGSEDLKKIDIPFDFPKPVALIKHLLKIIQTDKDGIILDFFSGSATTAHAVMQLNAEDGGNRKFIMVQLPEPCDEKSEAYKAGYKTICEIGKERIRRAGEKIKNEVEQQNAQIKLDEEPKKVPDIGFRVFKLDSTNMKDVYYSAQEYSQTMLAGLESNIKEDRTDLDLLYGCLLDWGLPLSLPHQIETIGGVKIHIVDENALIACFAEQVDETVIREIAKRKPLRAVFRDSSFVNSPDKINVEEIFKLLAPNTTVKVI